jgi:hypothetical protein
VKYFATADLTELMGDRAWLSKMTTAISQHWQKKNQRKQILRNNQFPGSRPPMSGEELTLAEAKKG